MSSFALELELESKSESENPHEGLGSDDSEISREAAESGPASVQGVSDGISACESPAPLSASTSKEPEEIMGSTSLAPQRLESEPEMLPALRTGPQPIECPAWGGFELLLVGLVLVATLLAGLLVGGAIGGAIALAHGLPADSALRKPSVFLVVPVQFFSYALTLLFLYWMVRFRKQPAFGKAVQWNFPGQHWWAYLSSGVLLAASVGLLSHLLPFPRTVPMDDFFTGRGAAFLLAGFGIFIVPPMEELLFRGFLYPVLVRWLGLVFSTPARLLNAALTVFGVACWGVVAHWVSGTAASALVLLLPFFLALPALAMRIGKSTVNAKQVILLASGFLAWGFLAHSLSYGAFATVSLVIFIFAFGFAALSTRGAMAWHIASLLGLGMAVLATSAAFAMVHAEQLGSAWGPLAMIFAVGVTLTLVRAATRSVAAGMLVHMGYNASLFTLLYVTTDGFRHLERMTQ